MYLFENFILIMKNSKYSEVKNVMSKLTQTQKFFLNVQL